MASSKQTMKTRRFDHIDLRVKDMAAAQKFYGQLLPALGFSVASGDDQVRTYQRPGEGPEEFFAFEKGTDHQPNDTRIAFWAESRAEVDRLTEIVRRADGLKLEGPEVCLGYSPGYYAVFFEDPSGNKLEICCRESRPS
jgi:catechol 2,3-dioxygenase-like lactoylglutathione lyase family enzyme